jgi:thioredoxin 1
MNQPSNEKGSSGTGLLIVGLLIGAAILASMAWDSIAAKREHGAGGADVMEFTAANWQREVMESDVPVLVDFSATWCGPCQQLAPAIDRLATRYKGKIKVGKVDVDKAPELAQKFHVTGIPHLIVVSGGKHQIIERELISEAGLKKTLDAVLARN